MKRRIIVFLLNLLSGWIDHEADNIRRGKEERSRRVRGDGDGDSVYEIKEDGTHEETPIEH